MIKSAYGDGVMVFELHELFRKGKERVEDDKRSGRTSMAENDETR